MGRGTICKKTVNLAIWEKQPFLASGNKQHQSKSKRWRIPPSQMYIERISSIIYSSAVQGQVMLHLQFFQTGTYVIWACSSTQLKWKSKHLYLRGEYIFSLSFTFRSGLCVKNGAALCFPLFGASLTLQQFGNRDQGPGRTHRARPSYPACLQWHPVSRWAKVKRRVPFFSGLIKPGIV